MSLRVTKKCLSAPVTLQQFRFRQCSTAAPPIVFKTYDDGLVLQQSTKEDSKQINEWWSEQENYPVSQNEMDLPIELYGKAYPKCSISGYYNGKLIGMVQAVPSSHRTSYGTNLFVLPEYREKGWGRVMDMYRRYAFTDVEGHVMTGQLSGVKFWKKRQNDMLGSTLSKYSATVKEAFVVPERIKEWTEVPFAKIMQFDKKAYFESSWPGRSEFLNAWFTLPGSRAFVSLDENGDVEGYISSREDAVPNQYYLGPVYAEDSETAERLMRAALSHLKTGDVYYVEFMLTNPGWSDLVKAFDMKFEFSSVRVRFPRNDWCMSENPRVFGVTSGVVLGH